MNGGVYEPLAARIARSYPDTTVHFPVTGGFVTHLCRLRSRLVHPARLLESDSRRLRLIGYNMA